MVSPRDRSVAGEPFGAPVMTDAVNRAMQAAIHRVRGFFFFFFLFPFLSEDPRSPSLQANKSDLSGGNQVQPGQYTSPRIVLHSTLKLCSPELGGGVACGTPWWHFFISGHPGRPHATRFSSPIRSSVRDEAHSLEERHEPPRIDGNLLFGLISTAIVKKPREHGMAMACNKYYEPSVSK